MVQENADEHGIHVTDIDEYEQLQQRIEHAVDNFDAPLELHDMFVFGSYGDGKGIPGQSDLDIALVVAFDGVLNDNERYQIQQELADHIEQLQLSADYPEITELEVAALEPIEANAVLRSYSAFESVTEYYSLTANEPRYYEQLHDTE